jgi:hypothetical protein
MLIISLLCIFIANSDAKDYRGFIQLKEKNCVALDKEIIKNLPSEWHKYDGFIKICGLKHKSASKEKVSIISIGAHDYLDAQPPDAKWRKFPHPIIVDSEYRQIGQLPEIYPMDWVTHLIVYYGKWRSGMPGEIRIDVSNPAVSGDYYYAPLQWDNKDGKYKMKSLEPITGSRPR